MEQKVLQVCMTVLVVALLVRIAGTWEKEDVARTLLFISSGRMVTQELIQTPEKETEDVEESAREAAAIPVFGESQQDLVQVNADWPVDTLELLRQPLTWDLMGEEPTVLILHSHATESYEKEAQYTETSPYRTLDTDYNMVSVGARVAEMLEAEGIRVIHDRTLHDYPSYNDAYGNARSAITDTLTEHPSVCLVLDLHRDAAEDAGGNQKVSTALVDGEPCANLMLVMGSDKGSLSYPNWERNLALAVKLQAQLEQTYTGLCRPIKLVTSRYNQDLSTGALLVEVGTAGNTHAQAIRAAEYLAEGIVALAKGANY
jgi:stage II sporulation protein P